MSTAPEIWIIGGGLYSYVVVRRGGQSIRLKRFDSDREADAWRTELVALLNKETDE